MKNNILKLMIVAGLIALSADLRAFTAVTSGAWSNAATWGGVGPGANVVAQDIIIPSGITVDMDMNVNFNGTVNSFWVTGTLMSTANHDLLITSGTLTGSGTIDIRKLTMDIASSFFSYTGSITLDALRNQGTIMNLMAPVTISDSLELTAGAVIMGTGSTLQLLANSEVFVNSGILVNNGGTFMTGAPFDVWYVGGTKVASEELNSASVRHVYVLLNSNADDLVLNNMVTVNGTLTMVSGHVNLNGNRLRVMGDLSMNPGSVFESTNNQSDLVIGGTGNLSSELYFESGAIVDELIISRDTSTVHLATELMVNSKLSLESGYFEIDSAGTLTMMNGSWITVIDGEMIQTGTFDGTQTYNVEYIGSSHTTGPELTGSGLNDLTFYLYIWSSTITLSQDVTVPGNFILGKGNLALDSFKLELQGQFHQADTTSIWGSTKAVIVMSMVTAPDDTLSMSVFAPSLYDLIIDVPQGQTIHLNRNLSIHHHLNFMSGRISTTAWITIGGNAAILGANDTNYIVTMSEGAYDGALRMWVPVNTAYWIEYPIGTWDNYTPFALKMQSPAIPAYVRTSVMEGVWDQGDTGVDVSGTQTVVNKTWLVERDTFMVILDARAGWGATSEVNGFDRSAAFMKNYYNNMWDSYPAAAAATGMYNTYTIERMTIPNDGQFAVVDNNSPLGTDPAPIVMETQVYPNPTGDVVNIEMPNPNGDMFTYEVYDATGRLVNSRTNADSRNVIDFTSYDDGMYTIRITNLTTGEVSVKPVVKS